ncbi:MAG: GntR family transcriptional regulator [Eubacteriales bacterium]|nr:GntR family transcriptional regulator [Eubacteriales bacterium]
MNYKLPLYIQLQDIIIKKIEDKVYLPGEAIPSERKLAEIYKVNRMTAKRAIEHLVEEGYLVRKAGSGTFVKNLDNKKIGLDYGSDEENTGLSAMLQGIGVAISNKVFACGEIDDSEYLAYQLGLKIGMPIWAVYRQRFGDNAPFAVEYSYVPKHFFPDIETFDFSKISLYDYMDLYHHMPIHFSQTMTICSAHEKIADLLSVKPGSAIFKIEIHGADADYNLVEYTNTYMNPNYADFTYNAGISSDFDL